MHTSAATILSVFHKIYTIVSRIGKASIVRFKMKYLALIAVVALVAPLATLAAPLAPESALEVSKCKVASEVFLLQGLDKLFAEFCLTQHEYVAKEFGDMLAHPGKFLTASEFKQGKPTPEEICKKVSSTRANFEATFNTEAKAISDRHDDAQVKEYLRAVSYASTPCVTTLSLGLAHQFCQHIHE